MINRCPAFYTGRVAVPNYGTSLPASAIIFLNVPGKRVGIIPGFFNLTHIHNPGGAFGFLAGQDEMLRSMIFVFVSTLAICFILYFYLKTAPTHFWLATGLAMIFGGAIGNLIDRIRFGKVVDFLDFYIGRLHWPAFNVADSAITIGILIFLFHVVFNRLPDSD